MPLIRTITRSTRFLAISGLVLMATSVRAQTSDDRQISRPQQEAGTPGEQVFGRTPEAPSGGTVGQRQTRLDAAKVSDPMNRISTRIENRIDNRIHNRIDRGYQGLDNRDSSLREATEQTQVEGKKSTR